MIDVERIPARQEILVLFSGGFDSTACAMYLKANGLIPSLLSIKYHNRPKREIEQSIKIASKLNLKFEEANVGVSDFRDNVEELENINFYNKAWLPYRNLIFFGVAANVAFRMKIRYISAGIRFWDTPYFTDSTETYFENLNEMLQFTGYLREDDSRSVSIVLPFIKDHTRITSMRRDDPNSLAVLSETWSCWIDGMEQCGDCSPCKARERFLNAIKTGDGINEFL